MSEYLETDLAAINESNVQHIHNVIADNLLAFISCPDSSGNISPADNVACLMTLIKAALKDLGYDEQETLDIMSDD